MKTVFVINPCAGSKKKSDRFISDVENVIKKFGTDAEMYLTQNVGDAEHFVRRYCSEYGAARFIACGGDGTLNEVLNGSVGCNGAEIGVVPIGTGNDFCRNFNGKYDFMNIEAQIRGKCIRCDAIRYTTNIDGMEKTAYCTNMFNIGFDCNVADMTSSMKKKPLISGSFAYLLSIFAMLVKKQGASLRIEIDGEEKYNGELLLTSIANGSYCGGGIMSNPLASVRSGNINVNIIKNVSRCRFIMLLPYYIKGTHMRLRGIDKVITSLMCKKMILTPLDDTMRLCIDGEITTAGKTEFEIVPGAFAFVVPSMDLSNLTDGNIKIGEGVLV